MHWWIIELLGLAPYAEGLYLSEGSMEMPNIQGSISFYKCSCDFPALSHGKCHHHCFPLSVIQMNSADLHRAS